MPSTPPPYKNPACPALRRRGKHSLTPLALAGLLLCGAAHAETIVFDGANVPTDNKEKLLNILLRNSFGPVKASELDINNDPYSDQRRLLNERHSNNQLTVKSGTIEGHVLGAAPSEKTNAENNQVLIEGGEIRKGVYGAHTSRKDASVKNNKVTITGGEVKGFNNGAVFGGYSTSGSAEGNSVLINGDKVVIGQAVYGGASNANAQSSLSAINNSVTVTAGTVKDSVIGGLAPRGSTTNGKAEGNRVLINGADAHVTGEIIGGHARDVVGNTVTLSAGRIANDVIGGYSPANRSSNFSNPEKIQLKNNKVVIEGSPEFLSRKAGPGSNIDVWPTLHGWKAAATSASHIEASGNTLEVRTKGVTVGNIKNFEVINFYLPADIQADEKVLTLSDSKGADITQSQIGVELPAGAQLRKDERVALIHTSNGQLISNEGNETNHLQAQSGSALLYAFKLSRDSKNLFATVLDDNAPQPPQPPQPVDFIFDGENVPADYDNKLTTIRNKDRSLGPVNVSELGQDNPDSVRDAKLDERHSGNTVGVKSGTMAGNVYGATPSAADISAEQNKVFVEGGRIGGDVHGASTSGINASASNNTVTISGGLIQGATYGGQATGDKAHAKGNTVTITGGTFGPGPETRAGYIYGGDSWNGAAEDNRVEINGSDAEIEGTVFGGLSKDIASPSDVRVSRNNTVTITAGTVTGQVIGGKAGRAAGNLADGNTVIINGADAEIRGQIMGGHGRNATNNTVRISAGKIANNVYGGYADAGTTPSGAEQMQATGNKLIIEGQPNFFERIVSGQLTGPELYGGYSQTASANVRTGNTLEMRTKDVAVKNIHNFERINFYLPADIEADDKVLTLTDSKGADITQSQIGVELPA
ncbi:MAG: hypothetical protein Q4A28_08665, partial [Brachymonas sp.]|nr:hypothetical protein [Brachymonas sp.]